MGKEEVFKVPKGWTDETLLQEFNAAEREVEAEGGPQPDQEGFKRLWEKLVGQEKGGHR